MNDQEEILIPSNQEFLFHMTFNLICCFDFKKSNAQLETPATLRVSLCV